MPEAADSDATETDSAAEHSARFRIVAAVLVAIIAAILGFAGVRIIADLASQSASQNGAGAVTTSVTVSIDVAGAPSPQRGA